MDGDELTSIVIGCYNQAGYLSDAIQSCLQQTYPKVEIVVIDDGSTDDTENVVGRFPSVRYMRQANQGVAVARNRGMEESRGSYVLFLDGDDRLLPDAIAASLECMRSHPASGCVAGRYRKIDVQGAPLSAPNRMCGKDDIYCALLRENVIGMLGAVLFRRAAVQEVGGFDSRFRASEDYDLLLRFARAYPIQEHNNLVAEYRWHDRNMSLDYSFMLQDVLDALQIQWPHVERNEMHRSAYREGIANWRKLYGSLLCNRVVQETRIEGMSRVPLKEVLTIGRYDRPSALYLVWRVLKQIWLRR